jgi:hypothetical protein
MEQRHYLRSDKQFANGWLINYTISSKLKGMSDNLHPCQYYLRRQGWQGRHVRPPRDRGPLSLHCAEQGRRGNPGEGDADRCCSRLDL